METDIGIWEIDRESRAGTELNLAEQVETEEMLEDVLVENPDMLMRGLKKLVGRQFQVETGSADLLGIDEDDRLVVFELKKEKLTRHAVAQVLDYGTYLEALPDSEIATLITERSGRNGITKISDFDEWYGSQGGESIKPVRMVLVGLGIDASARRMVAYLGDRGIDIEFLTFHGYVHGDALLLARHVRTRKDGRSPGSMNRKAEVVHSKAVEHGVGDVWLDARRSLDYSRQTYYTRSGITYRQRPITLPDDVSVRASHSVTVDDSGKIRVTFYPAAVDLCHARFEQLRESISFNNERPPNVPATRRAPHQWYCRLDEESWREGKALLTDFVRAVDDAWRKHGHQASHEPDSP